MIKKVKMSKYCTLFFILFFISFMKRRVDSKISSGKIRCYSCASENMKENFLTRLRGPQNRIAEPRFYDNLCDLDSWMIREKSAEECIGPCFKWQQILNNSGVLSYSTIRGCYSKMFDASSQMKIPLYQDKNVDLTSKTNHLSMCNTNTLELTCIDQSHLEEYTCWCKGDFCNSATISTQISFICFTLIIFLQFLLFIN